MSLIRDEWMDRTSLCILPPLPLHLLATTTSVTTSFAATLTATTTTTNLNNIGMDISDPRVLSWQPAHLSPSLPPRDDDPTSPSTAYERAGVPHRFDPSRKGCDVAMARGHAIWQRSYQRWYDDVMTQTMLVKPLVTIIYSYHSSLIYSLLPQQVVPPPPTAAVAAAVSITS